MHTQEETHTCKDALGYTSRRTCDGGGWAGRSWGWGVECHEGRGAIEKEQLLLEIDHVHTCLVYCVGDAAYTFMFISVYIYIYIYPYMYIFIYMYVFIHIHTNIYICTYIYLHLYMYVCIHIYVYICMYLCRYVHIYTQIS